MLPLVLLVVMLVVTVRAYGSDSLLGASQVTLLAVSACCVLIGTLFLRIPFKDFERAITHNISSVTSAILILLFIGSLSGTWMVSGVVPSLIFYGIKIIHPEIFLFSSCIISAMVSIMTGSSWTTIATIGIALMGIGRAQGFEDGWIAGAIISGAYFGDKISPLSDTTVLASGTLNVSIFKHIRYMLITTIPSLAISLVIFLIAGFCTASNRPRNQPIHHSPFFAFHHHPLVAHRTSGYRCNDSQAFATCSYTLFVYLVGSSVCFNFPTSSFGRDC